MSDQPLSAASHVLSCVCTCTTHHPRAKTSSSSWPARQTARSFSGVLWLAQELAPRGRISCNGFIVCDVLAPPLRRDPMREVARWSFG